jgi:hypothetical protein
MERMWIGEARHKYPKQWIVAVNLSWEANNRVFGDIYLVTSDKKEAYEKGIELSESGAMGKASVFEGFNDTPQIGGLEYASNYNN